jgi:hypothetical protein
MGARFSAASVSELSNPSVDSVAFERVDFDTLRGVCLGTACLIFVTFAGVAFNAAEVFSLA